MKIKGSRIIVESLLLEQVDTIFCYTGGSVISLFDDLHTYGAAIRCIQPRHEQGGVHAADAYARSTGKVGVVLVTSGPGATNTVTGIATAHMDSVPLVVITGQVATAKIGTGAFQEADITGMTRSATKAAFQVRSAHELAVTMKKAFHIARTGRPGPVLVDVPSDVQQQEALFHYPETPPEERDPPVTGGCPNHIEAAAALLNNARNPLVLAGGGVVFSDTTPLLNRFLDRFNIPVVHTLMGHGVNPGKEDLYYGGIGMHGSLYGNYALRNADVILALGVRFSDRILGDPKTFCADAKIIQVDIDPGQIGKTIPVHLPVTGTVRSALEALNQWDINREHPDWIRELKTYKTRHPLRYQQNGRLKSQYMVETAGRLFPDDTVVAADVGQNQMWVAQFFRFRRPRSLMSSSGMGTMGYGLPAAIGAKIGNPRREVLMIAGDGGFQMNLQELATIKKYDLNVKMLVLDNSYLGMVRQWQELLCRKRYVGTDMTDNPDFALIARAFGIEARTVSEPGDAEAAVRELAESNESMLLHARVDRDDNVLPMVPAGQPLDRALTEIKSSTGE